MRHGILCVLLALIPVAGGAQERPAERSTEVDTKERPANVTEADTKGSPVNVTEVDTRDVQLYYYNYLSDLAPLTIRTFTNARNWHRRMFGWEPSERTVVLLQDFVDYGNAHAAAAPRGQLVVDVAPNSRAFETAPSSERMYSTMNHELVHVVQSDIASKEDLRWRKFFLGKVSAQSQFPETLLYSYLTIPRFTTPRWYSEGGAVFLETWMAGGFGRAQGGYDEMVFRAMVRDDAHFYDPLGLVSRGTKVDFQTGANAYLYGGRFFTWLAYTYSPEKVVDWIRRNEDSKRYYADQFEHVFGLPLEKAWQEWIVFEHEFQRKNLAEVRKFPITPMRKLVAGALGSVSRLYHDEGSATLYGAFRYPGVVEHVGALDTRTGNVRRLADIKGAMHYMVASFAYDPKSGTAFYTNDNNALRDLMAVDVKTGESRMLLENASIGEIVFNPVDRSLIGVRHLYGRASLVRIAHPYDDWTTLYRFPWEHVPSDLDISPDGKLLSATMNDEKGEQYLRVWELAKVLQGDLKPMREHSFGQSVPESFVFTADGRYLYGSSYYTGVSNIFRFEVATGEVVAVSNAETGLFRPVPLADGRLVVLTYTGEGFVPAIIDPRPLEDVGAIRFLGAQVAEKYPVVKTWQVPGPDTVDDQALIVDKGPYVPLRKLEVVNAFPVLQGYKNAVGIGYHVNIEDPLQYASLGVTVAYTPGQDIPSDEQGHIDIAGRYRFWRAALSWNRVGLLRPVRPGQAQPQGLRRQARLRLADHLRQAAPPRPQRRSRLLRPDRHAAERAEHQHQLHPSRHRRSRAPLHGRAALARGSRRREGHHVGARLQREPRERRDHAAVSRRARPGLCAAARALVDLAAERGRHRQRRPQQHGGQFLLRRLRQQLRRRQVHQALPRVLVAPRIRHRRGERALVRARDGRVEPAAVRLRVGGDARPVPHVAATVAVRRRTVVGPGEQDVAPGIRERRRTGGLELQRPAPVRDDAVRRLRARLPGFDPCRLRVDDLAEDHVKPPSVLDRSPTR